MGIRNSFGIAVDPITGNIWDTENGFNDYDEINLMKPKTNSGWPKVQGPANEIEYELLESYQGFEYSDPEFSWQSSIAPTVIIFVNSELFNEYRDSVLVGDSNSGTIYKFKLNSERTGPWDSPGKNTEVGCHFLLQCMKVKSESEVSQSCPTPRDPMDCSLPGSSIHGIFPARVLEWGACHCLLRILCIKWINWQEGTV